MKRLLLISAAGLLATGCVTAKVRKAEVTPPPAYEAPTPAADDLRPADLDDWWTLYHDDQLNTLVEEALKNAPDAKSAFAVLEQAAAVRKETLDQIYIPSGQIQGTGTRTTTTILSSSSPFSGLFAPPGATYNYNANFDVSWEPDFWGGKAAAKRGANADFYSAAFTYEATRTSLIANVANSLFQARGLALQLVDAQDTARIDHELAHIADVKRKAGLGTDGDYDQAIATAESADAQAESLRAQLLAAQRSLLVLIGHGFDKVESLPTSPTVGTPPPVPATLPGDLLRRRPDVRAAEWKIVSASSTLKTDELQLLPTIKLEPGIQLTDSTGPFGLTSYAWSVAANLTQPVLDRPRLIAGIHAQRAVAEQDVIAYEKAVQSAYNDVETAFIYLDSDSKRVSMLEEAAARARSAYEESRLGYARGIDDLATALQAENTWRNVQSQLSSAEITVMERSVQAFKALGGGWSPDRPVAATVYAAKAEGGVAAPKGVR